MRIIALLSAFALTGCAGDRLEEPTKCDAVSAVLGNPAATRGQRATAMEMGRNNGCFGTEPPRRAGDYGSNAAPDHPEGNVVPNMGKPLTDASFVASSSMTSQCSASRPFSRHTISTTTHYPSRPGGMCALC